MITRRDLALAAVGSLTPLVPAEAALQEGATGGLRAIAARKGIIYGSAVRARRLRTDPFYVEAVARECAVVVAEGEMKWSQLSRERGVYDFSEADSILDFAAGRGISVRGHELIRPRSAAAWVRDAVDATDRIGVERIMSEHIFTVAGHFRGKLSSWDVINESLDPYNGFLSRKKSFWYDALGMDYIELAFHFTREADPTTKLVCNENLMEYEIPEHKEKRRNFLKLLEYMRKRDIPCHAVGLQSHLTVGLPFDAKSYAGFVREITGMGFEVLITELDVDDFLQLASVEEQDRIVADAAEQYLDAVLSLPTVTTVLTWGIGDRYSPRTDLEYAARVNPRRLARLAGHMPRPLPLDTEWRRKPVWGAMARAFQNAPDRKSNGSPLDK